MFNFSIVDKVICPSSSAKHTAMFAYGVPEYKISVIESGTDIETGNFSFEEKLSGFEKRKLTKRIISVGRETVTKRVLDFCRVAQSLSYREDLEFIFIGGTQDIKFHNELVSKYGEFVSFVGMRMDIGEFYKSAYFHLFLSHRESFPLVLAESMQFGLPSICWNVVGVRDLIGPSEMGFLVDFSNFQYLTDLIIKLLDDKEFYRSKSEYIYRNKGGYSFEKSYQMLIMEMNKGREFN